MLPEVREELPEVDGVLLRVIAGHVHVVDVGEHHLQVGDALSTFRWKVAPAFMNPKGIRRYSKAPKGVVIAVFCILAGCTGIW
jgi:hypothetical protein